MFFHADKRKQHEENIEKVRELYEATKMQLFKAANEIMHDEALAEDAVSETALKLIKHADRINFEDTYRAKCYAYIICRNTAIDMAKKKQKPYVEDDMEDIVASNASNPQEILISRETVRRIADAIKEMKPIYRDVLILKQHGLMVKEIAAELNITEEAAGKRLTRAKHKLAESLRKEEIL